MLEGNDVASVISSDEIDSGLEDIESVVSASSTELDSI